MATEGEFTRSGASSEDDGRTPSVPSAEPPAPVVENEGPSTAPLDAGEETADSSGKSELLRQVADTTGGIWDDLKDATQS